MAISLEPNLKLRVGDFPGTLDYRDSDPGDSSCMDFSYEDAQTHQKKTVFVKLKDLRSFGVSLTVLNASNCDRILCIKGAFVVDSLLRQSIPIFSKYLSAACFACFEARISLTNRSIMLSLCKKQPRLRGIGGGPGMYFFPERDHVFINLKGTAYLGTGSYGKIRQVLWLTSLGGPTVVAKKVIKNSGSQTNIECFERECKALEIFHKKRGIISIIGGGLFGDKRALFLPMYQCSFYTLLKHNKKHSISFTREKSLSLISQILEGLATISERGIHGDLSFSNLLLRENPGGDLEIVISDFGSFRPYGKSKYGMTTVGHAPPEYFALEMVSSKHDVWGAGLFLYELFSVFSIPSLGVSDKSDMRQWTTNLGPNWVMGKAFRNDTPRFILELMNQMLAPSQNDRPTAAECWERFSSGYESFLKENPTEEAQ